MTETNSEVAEVPEVAVEQPEVEVKSEPVVQEPVKKDSEHNWNEAREILKLQKQRIEDLEARLSQNQPVKQEDKDEFDALDPEELVTVGKAKELAKKLATKEAASTAKKVVEEYVMKQNVLSDEARMRAKHEDFDYVVENFAIPMIKNDAALAYKIQTSKNPAETAYKLAKISDEYEAQTMKQQTSPKAEKILKNSSRPNSAHAAPTSLKTQADDFSKMSQQQVWEMSQKYAKVAY